MGTNEREQPSRRASLMRLLAAALAGGIGAFGLTAAGHVSPSSAQPVVATPPPAVAPDGAPE
jgi:hypothetical protein